ncbi:hypothetical protein E2F48_00600 [Arthrobacter crusticola]|uniref:DUF2631 domain-containing protein n=1 Tax=Arthrobacter crusticola TaxID=2547960 RepID=A0A4R5U220_9MICC|nr:hypothetical protein [Arthrobacter crusticola]TDK27676.1 hypothetical protein E2F48_00600 [Arthrobacter crusticola]
MKSNADDPQRFDFHPWPQLPRSGGRSTARLLIGSIILAIIVIDTALSGPNLGRIIVACIVLYVVVIWMRRERPQQPDR